MKPSQVRLVTVHAFKSVSKFAGWYIDPQICSNMCQKSKVVVTHAGEAILNSLVEYSKGLAVAAVEIQIFHRSRTLTTVCGSNRICMRLKRHCQSLVF